MPQGKGGCILIICPAVRRKGANALRILVVSDTHGDFSTLHTLVTELCPRFDLLFHLGDGERDLDDLLAVLPSLDVRAVRGNCDWASLLTAQTLVSAGGLSLFLTHGHRLDPADPGGSLLRLAKPLGAAGAFFGHTHRQSCRRCEGVWLINPGSLAFPRDGDGGYALVTIENGRLDCELCRLPKDFY